MTNADIASIFERIGRILELQGENPFRIRAYDRAALTLGSHPRALSEIYKDGGTDALKEIPGIGEDLSLKIEELVSTGKLAYLEKLEKDVPPGVLDLLNIPGLGPKKVKLVWEEFKVKSIEDLKTLLDSGKLLDLKGWGEKSIEKIKQGIKQREGMGSRMPLPVAWQLADSLVAYLRDTGLCDDIEIAGSLRRRKESIGDIDVLVTSKEPDAVMDAFSAYPGVQNVIARGPTKTSILLGNGIQSDLRVLDKEVLGAAMHYFTGSKLHNVKVRTMGIKKGLTISEYGVFKGTAENKGKLLASRTEKDVFAAVGLAYIPPELREDRGEIEAALAGTLPELIDVGDIQGDLHMHSDFSDGDASMTTMAKAALAAGLKYIAITDHASSMGMVRGIKKDNVKEYLKKVEAARKAVPDIRILAGAEVDIQPDGSLYLDDETLAQLDWVVASIHLKFDQSPEDMTKRLLRAIENPHVRVLAHPTARLLLKRPGIVYDVDAVFRAAAKRGVALELNASPERLDLDDIHCMRAKELGAKIIIDSDAHEPASLNYTIGISQARRAWLTKEDVVNTKGWKEFEKCSKQKI